MNELTEHLRINDMNGNSVLIYRDSDKYIIKYGKRDIVLNRERMMIVFNFMKDIWGIE